MMTRFCSIDIIKLAILIYMLVEVSVANAKPQKEEFYSCQNGFQFETKKNSARCIKQERQSFRPPKPCPTRGVKFRSYKLLIDSNGKSDLCAKHASLLNKSKPNNPQRDIGPPKHATRAKVADSSFRPLCPTGFELKVKPGKDICVRSNAKAIKPPNKKVIL